MRRPDLRVEPVRGNVDTRLRKWREMGAGAVILAGAGLQRLGLRGLPVHPLSTDVLLPAPGQGTLALEVFASGPASVLCGVLDHPATARAAVAERRVVAAFGGDCTLPLAAWARPDGHGGLRLTALLATPDGCHAARGEAAGERPEEVAEACVAAMRENGADEVLARIRG
jgi:hydroxymethylbilane synthase